MSYNLSLLDNIVYLKYSGHVDALECVQVLKDNEFLPKLSEYKKVIYDFSGTQEIDLNLEETKRFSIIANVEANFIDTMHIAIVLSGPDGRPRAEYYRDKISAPSWRVDIVDTLAEAIDLMKTD